jgi:hypothetical protein
MPDEITLTPPSQLSPSSDDAKSISVLYAGDEKKAQDLTGEEAEYPIETISVNKLKWVYPLASLSSLSDLLTVSTNTSALAHVATSPSMATRESIDSIGKRPGRTQKRQRSSER